MSLITVQVAQLIIVSEKEVKVGELVPLPLPLYIQLQGRCFSGIQDPITEYQKCIVKIISIAVHNCIPYFYEYVIST